MSCIHDRENNFPDFLFYFRRRTMSAKLDKIMNDDRAYLFQNYGRLPACFVRGEKSWLFDQDNRRYIDFLSGVAVSSLGYSCAPLKKALPRQVDALIHTSNWFHNREQIEAARLLSEMAFPGKTLFANSGTEANEAALKLARRYGTGIDKKRFRIISFSNSFHGRTMGSMTATAQPKIHADFGPLVPGFTYLPYNDAEAFAREIEKSDDIAAVIIELVEGEGGIVLADRKFVDRVFSLCRKKGIITIVDEIQTGIGRTGAFFAYQHYGVEPDAITLAKGLGGGFPLGALHVRDQLARTFTRGSHGSTFGGNHLACAAAVAVMKEVRKPSFLAGVNRTGRWIVDRLQSLQKKAPIRGLGLHIGIELTIPGAPLVAGALSRGLVINCTADRVIRIMPPLNIDMKTVRQGMNLFEEIIMEACDT
jgi:acetylornithine aminotransferase/acetylornithine/N-succinyldiaminopimelate aminotransferase